MVLDVSNISKSFRRKQILKSISFNMQPGSLCGIVGENGSGKTTLLRIIVGELKADKGLIHLNGKFGYCPQRSLLFSQLTVDEHFSYFSSAYGIKKSSQQDQSKELLSHFNFNQYRSEKVINLSGGTQQKLNLSLALLHKPDLLILDEPYNGFDWDTYLKFWDYTDQLRHKGCAILIVTHLINEKERFDKIFDLKKGYLE